jgi:prepilin-type N-terminal cleavage/methylation domain-containing protein
MKTVKQSFTLVEILVVIVIIGILSSFIFFTINDSVEKASIAKSKMFSESIRNNLLLNLVSEWKLDGNTNDSWGSNNGTWHGSGGTIASEASAYLSESECISGQCMKFDGVDDYIVINNANLPINNTSYNISFWVNSYIFGYPSSACGNKNAFLVQWGYIPSSTGGVVVSLDSPSTSSGNLSVNGQLPYDDPNRWDTFYNIFKSLETWYYISINYDINTKKIHIFINGTGPYPGKHSYLEIDADYYPLDDSSSDLLYLGGSPSNKSCGFGFLNGKFDETQIYNAAISETAIKQNYLSGLNNLYAKGLITELEYNSKLSEL